MKEQSATTRSAPAKGLRKTGRGQGAGVGFFHDHDAGIAPEFPGQLAAPDIHRINQGRAVLQQAIGESAGGRAQINGGHAAGSN